MMKMYYEKYDILKEQCDICKSIGGATWNDCDTCEKMRSISECEQKTEADECPHGGDIADGCADCVYAREYHCVNGECVIRKY